MQTRGFENETRKRNMGMTFWNGGMETHRSLTGPSVVVYNLVR